MDCGMKCVKYLIFIFNFILLLIGMALIAAGVMVETMYRAYFTFLSENVSYASVLIIIIGITIFIISFFGCCGAIKESYRMIVIYTILLTIVILFQLGLTIAAFYMKDEIEETLELKMKTSIPMYREDNTAVYMSWNHLQTQLECCGTEDFNDWKAVSTMKEKKVPDTCCIKYSQGCGSYSDVNTIYKEGCLDNLKKVSEENVMMLGVFAGIFSFIQIVGIVFASCLAVSIRDDYHTMK